MDAQVMARWQFGITTVYHFLFVPITIALSMLVAVLQTIWYRTGKERYLKLTKFYGKLFLINFALGVVTGIVQEFQFGMNWSEYSRFVGDIFGAPLALEALLAFFLESTFLGMWIFGWDRLPKKLHLTAIYLASIGTLLSAIFILAANSWMQNPVGATYNATTGRAELTDFGALLTNPVFLATFPHTITAGYMVAGGLVAGIAGWHMTKHRKSPESEEAGTWRWAAKFGAWVLLVASVLAIISGDAQGKVMTVYQPMKMAAAEAHYKTSDPSNFSILSIGDLSGNTAKHYIMVPGLLGFLANGSWGSSVQGINDLNAQYAQVGYRDDKYYQTNGTESGQNELQAAYASTLKEQGITSISPNIPVAYWSFRLMMGLGFVSMIIALLLLWLLRKKNAGPKSHWFWTLLMVVLPMGPLLANSFGWIFAEMGRQPWIVTGVLTTASAVSPGVSMFEVVTSLVIYTLLYGALAVVEVGLMLKTIKKGLPEVAPVEILEDEDAPLSFAY